MKTAMRWCGLVLAAGVWFGGAAATAAGLLKVDLGGAWQVTMEGTIRLPIAV